MTDAVLCTSRSSYASTGTRHIAESILDGTYTDLSICLFVLSRRVSNAVIGPEWLVVVVVSPSRRNQWLLRQLLIGPRLVPIMNTMMLLDLDHHFRSYLTALGLECTLDVLIELDLKS